MPASTAWLLAGAVAVGLLALIVAANALDDARRLAAAYRPLSAVMGAAALAAMLAAEHDRRRGSWPRYSW